MAAVRIGQRECTPERPERSPISFAFTSDSPWAASSHEAPLGDFDRAVALVAAHSR